MQPAKEIAIRWTIGDVATFGFDALRLSIWGAWKIFGSRSDYIVCVNSIPLSLAQELTGPVPDCIGWRSMEKDDIPAFLQEHFDRGMSDGVGWKFAPVRLFPDRYELAMDNDCIVWHMPAAMEKWLENRNSRTCLIAEDMRPCFGKFERFCGSAPRNSGIRGLPPRFDYEQALKSILERHPVMLTSELDEQGMQVAAISFEKPAYVIGAQEVAICSPFPPHLPYLGLCGAHFVGLNDRQLPRQFNNRPAQEHIRAHWQRMKPFIENRIGLPAELSGGERAPRPAASA